MSIPRPEQIQDIQQALEAQRLQMEFSEHPEQAVRQIDAEVAAAVGLTTDAEYFGLMIMLRLQPQRMMSTAQCQAMLDSLEPVLRKVEAFLYLQYQQRMRGGPSEASSQPPQAATLTTMVRQVHQWGLRIDQQLRNRAVALTAPQQLPGPNPEDRATPPSTPTRQA